MLRLVSGNAIGQIHADAELLQSKPFVHMLLMSTISITLPPLLQLLGPLVRLIPKAAQADSMLPRSVHGACAAAPMWRHVGGLNLTLDGSVSADNAWPGLLGRLSSCAHDLLESRIWDSADSHARTLAELQARQPLLHELMAAVVKLHRIRWGVRPLP